MKRFIRYIKYLFLILISFIILYAAIAYICSQIIISGSTENTEERNITIFISTDEVHSDIVLPVRNNLKDWTKEVSFDHIISKDTVYTYIGFGWGNQDAFLDMPTWNDLSISIAAKAAFGLGKTAIHTTYYRRITEDEQCRKIKITATEYQKLIDFVSKEFKTDKNGRYINIETNAQYGYTDAFYEANGNYSILYSCNTWVNNALKKAEQKHCLWTVLSEPILKIYKAK